MSESQEPGLLDGLLDRLLGLRRWTGWRQREGVMIDGDIGHPQGLARRQDGWLVSTVFPDTGRGEVVVVGDDGRVHERLDVTDGERFHPGGIDALAGADTRSDDPARIGAWAGIESRPDGPAGIGAAADIETRTDDPARIDATSGPTRCWVAVAEYRPDSTTVVARLGTDSGGRLRSEPVFRFDDHLGALCELADGTLFAVSWGSRRWYRLDTEGQVLAERADPDHTIDLQDLQRLDGRHVAGTGVGGLLTPTGPLQLGGLVVIDVDELLPVHITPVSAWMPSGRVATFNATHLSVEQGELSLRCVVDDTTAELGHWVAWHPSGRPRS